MTPYVADLHDAFTNFSMGKHFVGTHILIRAVQVNEAEFTSRLAVPVASA